MIRKITLQLELGQGSVQLLKEKPPDRLDG
jgi:hypothetical protein